MLSAKPKKNILCIFLLAQLKHQKMYYCLDKGPLLPLSVPNLKVCMVEGTVRAL